MIEDVRVPIYNWKSVSASVVIDPEEFNKSGRYSVVEMVRHKIIDAEQAMLHSLHGIRGVNFEGVSYRRYRRGKNRCWVCGLKLLTKEHAAFEVKDE